MKILFHLLKGFGSPLTAIERVGYTKIYTSRGFELDKRNLAMDTLNVGAYFYGKREAIREQNQKKETD